MSTAEELARRLYVLAGHQTGERLHLLTSVGRALQAADWVRSHLDGEAWQANLYLVRAAEQLVKQYETPNPAPRG